MELLGHVEVSELDLREVRVSRHPEDGVVVGGLLLQQPPRGPQPRPAAGGQQGQGPGRLEHYPQGPGRAGEAVVTLVTVYTTFGENFT